MKLLGIFGKGELSHPQLGAYSMGVCPSGTLVTITVLTFCWVLERTLVGSWVRGMEVREHMHTANTQTPWETDATAAAPPTVITSTRNEPKQVINKRHRRACKDWQSSLSPGQLYAPLLGFFVYLSPLLSHK